MELRNFASDCVMRTLNAVNRVALAISGGRLGSSFGSMPIVELHTTGRSSGQRRSTLLTAPVHDDDRFVFVASKGGDDRHPDWYRNLVAEPDIEVTVDGMTRPMQARTASAEEKAQLWPQIVAAYRGYDSYQRRTERDIPVVICERRS